MKKKQKERGVLSDMNLTLTLLCLFLALFAAFLFLAARHPERLGNALLLLLTLGTALLCAASLFGDDWLSAFAFLAIAILAVLLVAPLLLVWNGFVMLRRESGRLANLLTLLLGLAVAAGEIAFGLVFLLGFSFTASGIAVFLFGASVFYFSALLLGFVLYVLVLPRLGRKRAYDTILIHGCALIRGDQVSRILALRLDLALELYHRSGDRALLLVSGGQGDDETSTEAEAMARYLLERGAEESSILREDMSHSTEENLVNAMRLLEQRGGAGRLALVTSGYHLYRCLLTAHRLGIRCGGYGARVAAYYWPSAVVREFAAVYSRRPYRSYAIVGYALLVLLPVVVYFFL